MPLNILIALALIQGATEFLPISSSGHLAIFPEIFGTTPQPLLIDVAVHIGTLFAVLLYYKKDTAVMFRGCFDILCGNFKTTAARLVKLLTISTIPVIVVGAILHFTGGVDLLRNPAVIGGAMILFALPLYLADQSKITQPADASWSLRHAIAMGAAQALALIPGASRSGVTMTAGRWLGYGRAEAARLSMLMSIPTIIASATLMGLDATKSDPAMLMPALIAAIISFGVAYPSIGFMLHIFKHLSMTPFVIYRLILGAALLILL